MASSRVFSLACFSISCSFYRKETTRSVGDGTFFRSYCLRRPVVRALIVFASFSYALSAIAQTSSMDICWMVERSTWTSASEACRRRNSSADSPAYNFCAYCSEDSSAACPLSCWVLDC